MRISDGSSDVCSSDLLDGCAARFVQWGIPFPELSATVSAGMEFSGGLLLMLGLLTRLTMIPMIFNMIVALVVVVLPTIGTLDEFVQPAELLYILVFFWFLMMRPVRASITHLLLGRPLRVPRVASTSP